VFVFILKTVAIEIISLKSVGLCVLAAHQAWNLRLCEWMWWTAWVFLEHQYLWLLTFLLNVISL